MKIIKREDIAEIERWFNFIIWSSIEGGKYPSATKVFSPISPFSILCKFKCHLFAIVR